MTNSGDDVTANIGITIAILSAYPNVDKIDANVPIIIRLWDTLIAGELCTNRPSIPNTNMILHWSPIDLNGMWVNPQDLPMSFVAGGTPGSAQYWIANIPGQPALTRVEFVFHSFGTNGDFWIKDGGKPIAACTGDISQKGWGRLIRTFGPNYYYVTLETPYIIMDYPRQNEIIFSPTYTLRIGTNTSANNVRVSIDGGSWSQCRFSVGYWWFDWTNYLPDAHQIVAESWNELSQRSQTNIRSCTYQPQ